ncbi:hypothetical protein [Gordonia sp. (in: high G+C Gram-positive bacteria)]|uniref:hypothetical protein n=1 Tax=Gordonia sp. (in: high G+C Gram-positive bacteria) TaxID=84139 RepID=UPI003341DAD4
MGISNPGREVQLILRHPKTGADLIVLDVLPKKALGAVGFQGITLGDDVEGLYKLQTATPVKSWAYQDGGSLGVRRVEPRSATITLHTQAATSSAFADVESLLWSVLSDKWDCYYRAIDPDDPELWRELRIRLIETPPDKTAKLQGATTHLSHTCKLIAVDPFWYSEPVTFNFTRADMTAVGGGYEIDVPIKNPTDQLGFIEWNSGELGTATETWSFQDGEATTSGGAPVMIPLPPLSGANKTFWVQTYPDRWQLWVKDQGQDWARMNSRTFTKAIAANTPDPRTIRARLVGGDAASSMMLTLPQRWDRPFGGELPIVAAMVTA